MNITLIQNYLKEIGSSLYEDSKNIAFADLCKSMKQAFICRYDFQTSGFYKWQYKWQYKFKKIFFNREENNRAYTGEPICNKTTTYTTNRFFYKNSR